MVYGKPCPTASVRLFCFPYAGGSALTFRNWKDCFAAFVDVWPIQLPGRGLRLQEPMYTSMDLLVDAIEAAISDYLDKPFAFFGHSMGAIIAFELCHKLRLKRGLDAAHLFASGCKAPQVPDRRQTFNLPQHELIEELMRLEGTPVELLENPDVLELMLPLLRADLELVQTLRYIPRAPLLCPITVWGGTSDKEVSLEDLQAWRHQSSAEFRLHMFPGNHFFLNHQQKPIVRLIAEQLSVLGAH